METPQREFRIDGGCVTLPGAGFPLEGDQRGRWGFNKGGGREAEPGYVVHPEPPWRSTGKQRALRAHGRARRGPSLLSFLWVLTAVLVTTLLVAGWISHPVRSGSPAFTSAYLEANGRLSLKLFPEQRPETILELPKDIPIDFDALVMAPDGRAIYGRSLNPGSANGIQKIELQPASLSVIPGSMGLSEIWILTVSHSGTLFVSGAAKWTHNGSCGSFEIDMTTGSFRSLRVGDHPKCGGGGGPISPDGKRGLTYIGEQLALIELESGAVAVIKGVTRGVVFNSLFWASDCQWSPDGRWIACARDGRIILIGADDTSERKVAGRAGNGVLRWSPDSKEILVSRSQLICGLGYGGSLEIVNISTGKTRAVGSSHCKIGSGSIGWVDSLLVP